jgi:hypothetical protein
MDAVEKTCVPWHEKLQSSGFVPGIDKIAHFCFWSCEHMSSMLVNILPEGEYGSGLHVTCKP